MKRFALLFASMLVVVLVVACTPAPTATPVPPTSTPTPVPPTIEGVQLQVFSVTRQNTYEFGSQKFTPNSSEDDCLIVEAHLLSGDLDKVKDWHVTVTDEAGRESKFSLSSTSTFTNVQRTDEKWIFVVTKTSKSFTLHLPGEQTVKLDSLLKK